MFVNHESHHRPAVFGCCHWNIAPIGGRTEVWNADLLNLPQYPLVQDALYEFGVAFEVTDEGRVFVNPDNMPLPTTYGIGTEPEIEDEEGEWVIDDDPEPPEDDGIDWSFL
jgi:hypothetical protein